MPRLLAVIAVLLIVNPALAADTNSTIEKRSDKMAGIEADPSQPRTEYAQWVKRYATGSPTGWFPGPDRASNVQVPLKLVVTAIEGDEPQANAELPIFRQITYGCQVAVDWRVGHFQHDQRGSRGGGYPTIAQDDQKRLDQLLSKLPDDGSFLPPAGRRMVLQVPDGDHFLARVYDRANAPDKVWEILRLSLCGIRSWVAEFKSENDLQVGRVHDGILALTPNGQLVSAVARGELRFWDSTTHKELKALPLLCNMVPQGIKFSPDGTLAVLTGWGQSNCCVVDTKTWNVVRDFQEPMVGRYGSKLYFPQFMADGRFLLFLCSKPDVDGHITILPRAYDTKTWEKHDKLPGLPENVLTCIEMREGKQAVVLLKDDILALWDCERHREYSRLDKEVQINQVAFSPDESMVAISTVRQLDCKFSPFHRIRIWKMDTGELLHELRPFEQRICENVVGLQWTPDGQYILAATKSHPCFTDCDINVWSVKSGRQRGNLSDGPSNPMGVVILPDGRHIAALGAVSGGGAIRFWDFAGAMKQIRSFEDSLAKPTARN